MVNEDIVMCANLDCKKSFLKSTHNQKYHNDECCRIATNRRIMEKYYERKAIRNGALRPCGRCGHQLSRYNKGDFCATCEKNINLENKSKLFRMLDDIS